MKIQCLFNHVFFVKEGSYDYIEELGKKDTFRENGRDFYYKKCCCN